MSIGELRVKPQLELAFSYEEARPVIGIFHKEPRPVVGVLYTAWYSQYSLKPIIHPGLLTTILIKKLFIYIIIYLYILIYNESYISDFFIVFQ